jgi:enoyl-CoA hydratase/carnithine racemase
MAYEDIVVEKVESWVEISINRPEKRNALRNQTATELQDALTEAEKDPAVRAVIVKSTERGFCAGVDTSDFNVEGSYFQRAHSSRYEFALTRLFRGLPDYTKPIISAIEGYALGGGFEFALLGDIIVMDAEAKVGLPEARLGIMPGAGGTQTLARLIGKNMAKEIIWTGRFIEGAEAKELGIANHVTPVGESAEKAREIARAIAGKAPISIMFTKQAINRGSEVPLAEGLQIEANYAFALNFSEDRSEGLKAFAEKRDAKFKGE